jgi:hypothetical protein
VTIGYVLDTDAVLGYGRDLVVGSAIAAAGLDRQIAVPVLCLAAGYRSASAEEGIHLLDALANQPAVTVTPVHPDDAPILGGWAGILGSFDLAHAVLEAATHHVPLVTSQRKAVTRILPAEWPIIDI